MYHGLDKQFSDDDIVFMDVRSGTYHYEHEEFPKTTIVAPDIRADLKRLPFREQIFSMIIFDPPHARYGSSSYMNLRYGCLSRKDYSALVVWANIEFARVLKPQGYVYAKVFDYEDRPTILKRCFSNFKPLLDIQHTSKASATSYKTHWMLFVKSS